MFTLLLILLSTFLVSVISLIGLIFVSLNDKLFNKALLMVVSFASGSLLGSAFFHLIPEAFSPINESVPLAIVLGIIVFFLLEKFLWRHCHEREKCPVHPFIYLNLIGDGVHNAIDGIIIAASFIASIPLGITTTLAVTFHEIPQEIGDFGILLYGGFSKTKALLYNFITAITAIVGALITWFFIAELPSLSLLLAFAAGGFIYIATTDLIPELHKERKTSNSFIQFLLLSLGLVLMWILRE